MVQGQPNVIIWIVLVALAYMMLHTKFQDHLLFGSGEDDIFKVFTIYGHSGHVGHVTKIAFSWSLEIRLQLAQWFQRRSRLKLWADGRRRQVQVS